MIDAYKLYWKNALDFKGRARRAEYWWPILVNIIIAAIFGILIGFLGVPEKTFNILISILAIIFIVPNSSVLVRRIHDVGKTGKLAIPAIFYSIFNIIVEFVKYKPGYNNLEILGDISTKSSIIILILILIFTIYTVYLLILSCTDSEAGENKYGLNPKHQKKIN